MSQPPPQTVSRSRSSGTSLGLPASTGSQNRRPSSNIYIESNYEIGEKLGSGAFGVVHAGTSKADGREVAIKIIPKEKPSDDIDPEVFAAHMEQVHNEIKALKELTKGDDCVGIIPFRGSFETKEKLYIVMDRAHGELADVISQGEVTVTEKAAQEILKCVLTGVAYMHERDYAHRDLKFENLLLMKKGDFSSIVLTDFGLATRTNEAAHGECGTPLYMAPEIWLRDSSTHGTKVDIWATGIIAYIIMCGRHPVKAKSLSELKAKVCVDRLELDFSVHQISDSAKDFIRRMLTADPVSRPAAKDALAHPFITGEPSITAQGSVVDMLRGYAAEQRLKKGFHLVASLGRMQRMLGAAGAAGAAGAVGAPAADSVDVEGAMSAADAVDELSGRLATLSPGSESKSDSAAEAPAV